ncbi:hypothetical protein SAMN04488564_12234 [Lentzea waywayandensis]|uniref:Uncharacterized protein n=1 Tax=Lentzea waywayandensis TaxID=84724 RepID=A0A1I6FIS7_9PSEU|nr:hypothetical protein [Lentzea waywayandensis]SFR29845.1 hypothetical protein SAMN04488564_12234 [Lentzea waywayandensis]
MTEYSFEIAGRPDGRYSWELVESDGTRRRVLMRGSRIYDSADEAEKAATAVKEARFVRRGRPAESYPLPETGFEFVEGVLPLRPRGSAKYKPPAASAPAASITATSAPAASIPAVTTPAATTPPTSAPATSTPAASPPAASPSAAKASAVKAAAASPPAAKPKPATPKPASQKTTGQKPATKPRRQTQKPDKAT